MECPGCRKPVRSAAKRCSSCGYLYPEDVLEKMVIYFDLKRETEELRSTIKTNVWPGLQRITGKIDLLQKSLATDLVALAASPEGIAWQEAAEPREEATAEPEPAKVERKVVPPVAPPSPAPPKLVSVPKAQKKESSDFEIKLGQKWLLIVGIVTMVFGVGYFLKYSFDKGWIGPAGRVAMAYLWGLALLAGGSRAKAKFENFGLYVIGGGIATLYFSTFAGFQIYHLFGQAPSFLVMIMITALACALSVVHDAKWLAVLGLVGGFFTPVMLGTGHDEQIVLMTYMSILNFGILSIAFYKKWDLLNYLGFAFTYLLYSTWYMAYYQNTKFWPSIIFLNIFYLTYSIIPFAYRALREEGDHAGAFLMTAANSFIAFGFSYQMIRSYSSVEWVSVISISYALLSLIMAWHLYSRGEQGRDTFVLLAAKTALFLIITVPIIFSKHWITIFWAAQALTLLWAGLRLEKRQLLAGAYLLLGLALGKFLVYDYPAVFRFDTHTWSITGSYTYLLLERLLTSGLLLLVLQRFSAMLKNFYGESFAMFGRDDSKLFSALLGIMVFVCLNVEVSSFFLGYLPYAQPAAICVLWAAFSLALILLGSEWRQKGLIVTAYLLFAAAALKFLLHDYAAVYHFDFTSWTISGSYTSLILERMTTALILLSVLIFSSSILRRNPMDVMASSAYVKDEHIIHNMCFGILLFIVLNIETGAFFHEYLPAARFAAISVLWALFSVVLMLRGFSRKSLHLRRISLALFMLTLVKVFLLDMANVGTPYRIVSFIVLGILLVGTSYLYYRFKDRILGIAAEAESGAGAVK